MDTKWKKLSKSLTHYGMNREDMYQIYAYSKKYHTSTIYLLYPINNEARTFSPIVLNSGDGMVVHVWFINLENIKENLLLDIENK